MRRKKHSLFLILSVALHAAAVSALLRFSANLPAPQSLLEVTLTREVPRAKPKTSVKTRPENHAPRRNAPPLKPRFTAPRRVAKAEPIVLVPEPTPLPTAQATPQPTAIPTPIPTPLPTAKPTPKPTPPPVANPAPPDNTENETPITGATRVAQIPLFPAAPLPDPIPQPAEQPNPIQEPDKPVALVSAGEGTGSGTGKGSGQGSGEGSGQGSGNGAGQGSGIGSGKGAGQGSGAGAGQGTNQGDGAGQGKGAEKGNASGKGEGNASGDGAAEKGKGAGEGDNSGTQSGDGNSRGDGNRKGAGGDGGSGGSGGSGGGGGGGGGGKSGGGGKTGGGNGENGATPAKKAGGGLPFGVGDGGGGQGPRHIVYLIDVSLSMEPRLARAKQELRAALRTLQANETFNIVSFYGKAWPLSKKMLPATPDSVTRGEKFITALRLNLGTNLERAMETALFDPDVNVVVVITDGVPTYGERNFDRLAARIRALNRGRARIFTIGLVGKDPDGTDQSFEAEQLLRQVASDNNGEFRLVALDAPVPK